jgi:transcription termination factor 2
MACRLGHDQFLPGSSPFIPPFDSHGELLDMSSSPSIIRMMKPRRMRWAGHVARMGEKRSAYRLLVGELEGKRPLGKPRRRWMDNIRMDLGDVGWGDAD